MTLELLSLFLLAGVGRSALQKCFEKDSISCFQLEIYRTARNLFGKSRIDFAGVSLRQAKLLSTEDTVMSQQDVKSRQRALEDYFVDQVKHLWNKGSVIWCPIQTARTLIDSIPSGVTAGIAAFADEDEGRGKDKKHGLNTLLLPFLLAVKLKLTALWYVFIALIAKKAVLAGLISLLVSGFIATKKMLGSSEAHQELIYHPDWSPVVQQPFWSYAVGKPKHQDLATSQRRAVPYVHQKEVTPERNNSIS